MLHKKTFSNTCGTWKRFQVKHVSWNGLFWDEFHHTQISRRNASCAYIIYSFQATFLQWNVKP